VVTWSTGQGGRALQSRTGLPAAPVQAPWKPKSSEADMEPEREAAQAPRTPRAEEKGDA